MNTALLPTWVEINRRNLLHNIRVLKRLAQGKAVLGMVKCDAYGHGKDIVSQVCQESSLDWLGTESVDAAVELRKAGVTKPILITSYTPIPKLSLLIRYNLSQVISDVQVLQDMVLIYKNKPFTIQIKVDTGMSRQGISIDDLPRAVELLKKYPHIFRLQGLLTHLADAENILDRTYTNLQIKKFKKIYHELRTNELYPELIHACNTAGLLTEQNHSFITMYRSGAGLYGLLPGPAIAKLFTTARFRQVLSWKTRIAQIKIIPKGQGIGYGMTEKAKKNTRVAVLPVGYYYGIPRNYARVGHVLIQGQRCRILGGVSMNLIVVDISGLSKSATVWDEVVIIGSQKKATITAEKVAEICGSIPENIVTGINAFVPRILITS